MINFYIKMFWCSSSLSPKKPKFGASGRKTTCTGRKGES